MTVLITGASGGLGRALAMECAQRGYDLYLTDLNGEGLRCIQEGILRQYAVTVHEKACDLTKPEDAEALFSDIRANTLGIHILLQVAGIDFEGGFMDLECEQLIDIVRVNIEASLRVIHHALDCRVEGEKFNLVVVSSLASLYPMPLKATYAASKRFLLDFSLALSQELKEKNVTVLALCPGGLPTTQGALQGIAAQGIWGKVTTNSLPKVARRTLTKALKGKSVYIPGMVNRVFSIIGRLVPRRALTKILYARWQDTRSKNCIMAGNR